MKILKFGGTSIGDASQLESVIEPLEKFARVKVEHSFAMICVPGSQRFA